MKYFIAHVLSGRARTRHMFLCNEIEKYFKITKKIPAHVTLKGPFEADDKMSAELEKLLETFSQIHQKTPLKFSGFGAFGEEVIFVKVVPSAEALKTISELDDELKKIKWLDYNEFESNRKLHATLSNGEKTGEKFQDIMNMLSGEKFEYDEWLDNISILRKIDGKWEIYKKFELK